MSIQVVGLCNEHALIGKAIKIMIIMAIRFGIQTLDDGDDNGEDGNDDGDEHGKEERLELNENHLRRRMTMRWQPRM